MVVFYFCIRPVVIGLYIAYYILIFTKGVVVAETLCLLIRILRHYYVAAKIVVLIVKFTTIGVFRIIYTAYSPALVMDSYKLTLSHLGVLQLHLELNRKNKIFKELN